MTQLNSYKTNLKHSQNLSLNNENNQKTIDFLKKLLYSEFTLYKKTREYHWNIESDNFMELHKLYESQYQNLATNLDDTAEKIRILGGYVKINFAEAIGSSIFENDSELETNGKNQIQSLLNDYFMLIQNIRIWADQVAEMGDTGTNDFLVGLLQEYEKQAWILKSYAV
jgi:starvation-inducible DNA-binding protein